MGAEISYDELLAFAAASDEVLGAFLFGSRGRRVGVDEHSDLDVWVVLRDEPALAAFEERYPYAHGAPVEVASSTLEQLRAHGAIGSASEWARYQHAHVEVLLDKTDGELTRVLEAKEYLPDEQRDPIVRAALGAYVNSTYRSLRYRTRLDAVESVGPALTVVFGLAGRIRPFNKYLEWELRNHPLAGWDADVLLSLVARVLDADQPAQHDLFVLVEAAARAGGLGEEIDGWEPDVAWLRGEAGYRAWAR